MSFFGGHPVYYVIYEVGGLRKDRDGGRGGEGGSGMFLGLI